MGTNNFPVYVGEGKLEPDLNLLIFKETIIRANVRHNPQGRISNTKIFLVQSDPRNSHARDHVLFDLRTRMDFGAISKKGFLGSFRGF